MRPRTPRGQDAPQALDERAVGDPGLLLVAAADDHRGAKGAGVAGQLGGQPGLADAGLALDHHQPPVAGHSPVASSSAALLLPPDQRDRPPGRPPEASPRARGSLGTRPRVVLPRGSGADPEAGCPRLSTGPGARRPPGRGGGRRAAAGAGGWREAVGLDRLVDRDRLLQGLDPQLLLQDPLAGLQLARAAPRRPLQL